MNRRPAPFAAIALAVVGILSLSACGSGDDGSKGNDKIAGAGTGADSSTSTSPSESAPDSVERPVIELPSDVKNVFTPEVTGKPVEDAILRDNAELVRALDAAIVAQNPRLPALEFYTEGEGAASAEQWVQGFKEAGWTVTGHHSVLQPCREGEVQNQCRDRLLRRREQGPQQGHQDW
ncbi:hypothetical protein ACFU5P_18825 [Streptomyces sp. NPDC057433]|uniref:hypothetical protein n=1 Tax=Streptomyces sp. NPDC057433 TaxID=3346132 RepID=UPI00368CDB4D